MIANALSRLVAFCFRHALAVVLLAVTLAGLMAWVTLERLRISTDTTAILSRDLDWRQREFELRRLFPQKVGLVLVVVDGATPEIAEDATARLYERMAARPDIFTTVRRPEGGDFFRRNGLLYLPQDQLAATAAQIVRAQPLIGALAADPSLRGLFDVLSDALRGVEEGQITAAAFAKPLEGVAAAIEGTLAGTPRPVSWQTLITGREPGWRELRRFIMAQPIRDYSRLEPGERASQAIRGAVAELGLTEAAGVRVRLTGEVPLADEEFATVAEGTNVALKLSLVLVAGLLFLALRSWRLIVPILLTLIMGLIATAFFAAITIGSLNVISVSFAVLFVGIGVDFGIQFAVRYRHHRFLDGDMAVAMRNAGSGVGPALLLAAAATAVGFFSFIPTDYRGVSELGLISGIGMGLAALLNLTLLPALLGLFRPPPEPEAVGYAWAAPIDRFLQRRRLPIVALAGALSLAAMAILPFVGFDMNPLNLKDPKSESASTLRELMANPETTPYTIELLMPSIQAAAEKAREIAALPEVMRAVSVSSFIPREQEAKLEIVEDLRSLIGLTLTPPRVKPPPSDAEIVAAIERCRAALGRVAQKEPNVAVFARLDKALADLQQAGSPAYAKAAGPLLGGLKAQLQTLALALQAGPVGLEDLPAELMQSWVAADGRARIEVFPRGDSRDNAVLEHFVARVRTVAPQASGTPVTIYESAQTVRHAFVAAGFGAFIAITLLMTLLLRRLVDVGLVIAPLLMAGLLTLATTVPLGLTLNYANVIALPLLLGVGVAFSIYFVMNWRAGIDNHLQSGTARAILFSGFTTGTAFGCLAASSHKGTAGMGILLTISLIYMLACTLLVQPSLLALARRVKVKGRAGAA